MSSYTPTSLPAPPIALLTLDLIIQILELVTSSFLQLAIATDLY